MYILKIIDWFSAAHKLRGYKGKCETLHGHNWKIEMEVLCKALDTTGLAIDFSEMKKTLKCILNELDHTDLNQHPYFKKVNPTSEHLAHYIFIQTKKAFLKKNVQIYKVTVWESESACATYM